MKNKIFYSAFGVLTVAFSRMEADLRKLISGIAFNDNSIVASAFLDSSQLNENIRILKKLSRQYWEDEEERFLEIITSIGSIRETRNLFIHGVWNPGKFGEPNGFATVTDLKTAYKGDEEQRSWNHSQTLQYSINDFQKILDSVYEIIGKIENLCEHFTEDEDIQFGHGGLTAHMKPVIVSSSKPDSMRIQENEERRE